MSNLLKRLEIIQSAIDLGDEDVVALQTPRLPSEAAKLAQLLEQHEYANADRMDGGISAKQYHAD